MKKVKIALYIFAITSLFASCEDTLDIVQDGQLAPELTYVDYASILKNYYGVYATLSYNSQIGFNSIWTDENAIGVANGGQGISDGMYSYVLNPENDYASGIWYGSYSTINNCNRFIQGAEKFLAENVIHADELTGINQMITEVRALRAFSYHELMTYFVKDYSDVNGLGVMLFDDVPAFGSTLLPRATVGEVYDFIEDDLSYVLANYDLTAFGYNTGDQPKQFFVTKEFVYALRARMNLYRGNYSEAITNADLALQVPLAARASYAAIWSDTGTSDVIFKMSRIAGNSTIGSTWASVSADARTGSQFFEVGRSLYNLAIEFGDQADIRKGIIAHPSSVVSPNYTQALDYRTEDILSVGKYVSSHGTRLLADLKIFRSSEMALIKAEAYTMLGQTTLAQSALNDVRSRRVNGPGGTRTFTGVQATDLKFILDERRLEFAFEGFRWVDIKRVGPIANVTFERDQMDCDFNNSCTAPEPITSNKFTLPIPSSEVNTNNLIIQNPGY